MDMGKCEDAEQEQASHQQRPLNRLSDLEITSHNKASSFGVNRLLTFSNMPKGAFLM